MRLNDYDLTQKQRKLLRLATPAEQEEYIRANEIRRIGGVTTGPRLPGFPLHKVEPGALPTRPMAPKNDPVYAGILNRVSDLVVEACETRDIARLYDPQTIAGVCSLRYGDRAKLIALLRFYLGRDFSPATYKRVVTEQIRAAKGFAPAVRFNAPPPRQLRYATAAERAEWQANRASSGQDSVIPGVHDGKCKTCGSKAKVY